MLGKHRAHVLLGSSLLFLLLISLASLTLPVHASGTPDLTVESVWLENSSRPGQPVSGVSPGEQFDIVVTVKNLGDATAYGFYLDVYYDSDYGRGGPDDIGPSEVQTWYVGPLTAESGTHTTSWVVDPDNQIAELNELNNENVYQFTAGSIQYSVTVLARTAGGSAMSGVKVTLSNQDNSTDSSGKAEFSSPAGTYTLGVQASVSAGSGIQYVFVQWGDGSTENPRSITVNAPAAYDATYKTQYQLAMQVDPSGSASTTPPVGTHWYDSGQTVTIQVSPASGYTFRSWAGSGSGSYTGTANPASVTMNAPVGEAASLAKRTAMISWASVVPDPVTQGSKVIFNVGVVNVGTSKASSLNVQLAVYGPDGSLAGSASARLSKLSAGAQKTIKVAYTIPPSVPSGVWTYSVYLYVGGVLLDQKTDGSFTVDPAVITGSIISVSDSPDPVARGKTVTFAVTVKNTGNIVWPAVITIKIYGPDGALTATRTLTGKKLQPNVEYTYRITWKAPSRTEAGVFRYEVYLNYGSVLIGSSTDSGSTDPGNTVTVN